MSIQRYDCGPANELDEVEDGNYVNYWDHLNAMSDTFAAKMRLSEQVDDHKAALAKHKDLFNDIRYALGYRDQKRYDELCDRIEAVMEEMK